MPEFVYYYDDGEHGAPPVLAVVVSRGAYASTIEYHSAGLKWQVTVSNDDIEFIGDNAVDDDED